MHAPATALEQLQGKLCSMDPEHKDGLVSTSPVAVLCTQDMENTTGAWDMYGKDEKARYNGLQSTFFTQATDVLTRRDSLRAFVAAGGLPTYLFFDSTYM
jgi:hypothetical protein